MLVLASGFMSGCFNPNVIKRALYMRQAKLQRIRMSGPDGGQVDVKLVVCIVMKSGGRGWV